MQINTSQFPPPLLKNKKECLQQDKEQVDKRQELKIIIFPPKYLDPFKTYRMNGDFHLYADARHIYHTSSMKLGISCQNPFKKISKITVDQQRQQIVLQYTQLDFTATPWEFVCKRLLSSGNQHQHKLSQYIQAIYKLLNNKQEICDQKPLDDYRATAQYQYKHYLDLDQIVISQVTYDSKFIQEMGFGVDQFIRTCLKSGIPEISLKPNSTSDEYYNNIIEFLKPLIEPLEPQDFYYYSNLYPYGLKTQVQFRYEYLDDINPNTKIVNLNIYLNYQPTSIQKISNSNSKTQNNNCISQYYNLGEQHYDRCGTKKIKY